MDAIYSVIYKSICQFIFSKSSDHCFNTSYSMAISNVTTIARSIAKIDCISDSIIYDLNAGLYMYLRIV